MSAFYTFDFQGDVEQRLVRGSMNTQQLCTKITKAFADVEPPIDYRGDPDSSELTEISATLAGIEEDGFYFFLPKVMCYLLTDEARQAEVSWPELAISAIDPLYVVPSGRRRMLKEKQQKLSHFSQQQLQVVIEWLQWMRDKEGWTGVAPPEIDAIIQNWQANLKEMQIQ